MPIYRKDPKQTMYDAPKNMIRHAPPKKMKVTKYAKKNNFLVPSAVEGEEGADE